MSNALLKLVILFVLVSFPIINAQNYAVPTSDAPTYCQSPYYVSTGPTPAPGQTGYQSIIPAGTNSYSGSLINNSIALSVLALTLSFAVVAIGYILSKLVPNLGVKNWLQAEYWEIIKTAIIIAVIFAMITIVSNIVVVVLSPQPVFTNAGDITPLVNGAETYLCGVNSNLMNTWGWMGLLGAGTGFWANLDVGNYDWFSLLVEGPGFISGSTFVPFNNWMLQTGNAMIGPYGSVIGDTVNLLLFPFTVINLIVIYSLPSMVVFGLTLFIPLGLFFRALPFIRGIGGTMIAIGLGLCLVFPATLILFNGVFMNYITQTIAIAPPVPPSTITGWGTPAGGCPFSSSFGLAGGWFCHTIPINPVNKIVPQLWSADLFTSVNDQTGHLNGANVFSDTAIYQYMDIMLAIASYITVQLVIITIDLVIVYSITDSIARALGGSVRLQLGGKLRIAS